MKNTFNHSKKSNEQFELGLNDLLNWSLAKTVKMVAEDQAKL